MGGAHIVVTYEAALPGEGYCPASRCCATAGKRARPRPRSRARPSRSPRGVLCTRLGARRSSIASRYRATADEGSSSICARRQRRRDPRDGRARRARRRVRAARRARASVARLARATPPSSRARGGVPSWVARPPASAKSAATRRGARPPARGGSGQYRRGRGRLKSELASAGVALREHGRRFVTLDWQPPADKASRGRTCRSSAAHKRARPDE